MLTVMLDITIILSILYLEQTYKRLARKHLKDFKELVKLNFGKVLKDLVRDSYTKFYNFYFQFQINCLFTLCRSFCWATSKF